MNSNYISKIGLVREYSKASQQDAVSRIESFSGLLADIAKTQGSYISSDRSYIIIKGGLQVCIKFEQALSAIDEPLVSWATVGGVDLFGIVAEHQKTFYYYSIYLETIWHLLNK